MNLFVVDNALWLALIHTSRGISWTARDWWLAAKFAEAWGPPEAVPEEWSVKMLQGVRR
jgi:hypothetical protein